MNDFIVEQLKFFSVAVVTGIIGGVIFDFFRSIRKGKCKSKILVAIEDVALWIGEAVLIFASAYQYNNGGLRMYFFVGFLIGLCIYLVTVSKAIVLVFFTTERLAVFVFKIIYISLIKVCKVLLFPFVAVFNFLVKISGKIKAHMKKTKKLLKMY